MILKTIRIYMECECYVTPSHDGAELLTGVGKAVHLLAHGLVAGAGRSLGGSEAKTGGFLFDGTCGGGRESVCACARARVCVYVCRGERGGNLASSY